MTMKLAAGSAQVDVINIVQDHPSLLLHQHFVLDQEVLKLAVGFCMIACSPELGKSVVQHTGSPGIVMTLHDSCLTCIWDW